MPPSRTGGPRISQGEPLSGPRPGTFDFTGGMMPHPMNPMETGLLANNRPGLIDGRQVDPHLSANAENGPFGQSSRIHSNTFKVDGILGKGAVGGMQERNKGVPEEPLKPYPEDHLKPFPLDSGRHVIHQSELEDLKKFPGPVRVDGENVSKFDRGILDRVPQGFGDRAPHLSTHGIGPKSDRSVFCQSGSSFPVGSASGSIPADAGDRFGPTSLHNYLEGNTDPSGVHPDFLKHVSEFGRCRMDNLPFARTPGGENLGIPSSRFGSSLASLGLGSQARLEDTDGRDSCGFGECSKAFGLPSDSVGSRSYESWFPMFSSAAGSGMLPNHLCWGELDGPSNSQTSGQLGLGMPMRSSDLIGADILPLHLRGGEPRSLPGHLCVGEPLGPGQLHMGKTTNLGGFSSHLRMGEMAGLGHLPSHLHMGDPIGEGSFPSHTRVGEPGFGGSFPMQGFQGSIKADTETFDQSRKRRPGRMGWCRICIIDCETVEGLDLHSQTREHQKMAMQMVLSIRQDNAKKKQKLYSEDHSREDANKPKKAGLESRGCRH